MIREAKRAQTKQLILEATKDLVRDKGCSKMTLNDIMDRTGLSKGAIYHYVKSKDELLAWVLKENLEDISDRFFAEVKQGKKELEGPLQEILKNLPSLQDPNNVINQIFFYLLVQKDKQEVNEIILRFYEKSIESSKQWIISGQQEEVIPLTIDANKISELFVLISFGLRMRSAISPDTFAFTVDDFSYLMRDILRGKKGPE